MTTLGWCYLSCISTLECQLIDLQGSVNHAPRVLPPHCEPPRGHQPLQMWLCLQRTGHPQLTLYVDNNYLRDVCWGLIITDDIFCRQPVSLPLLTHNWHQTHHSIEGPARVCSLFLVTVRLCVAIPKNLTKSRSENTKKWVQNIKSPEILSVNVFLLVWSDPGNTIIMNDWVDCWWVDVVLIPPGSPWSM